jgi:predicted methyltransferase
MSPVVLSHFQAAQILQAKRDKKTFVTTSTDLGITSEEVQILPDAIRFAGGASLTWNDIEEIHSNKIACFLVEKNVPRIIKGFSELSGRYYSLMPTESAPTMLISGIPMHRIKGTNPYRDTLSKIRAIAPVKGYVLDTTTGLGYTAIEAAKSAIQVVTIELDPQALEMAHFNPWSLPLFNNPKIKQIIGDSFEEIGHFEAGSFSCMIHDPPTLSLAGELYSKAFYEQAFRVLKHNGRMFHYIGDPDSKTGARTTKGVVNRLREAGFIRVIYKPQAFGLVAYK